MSGIVGRIDRPTLVMHARRDGVHPLEEGRAIAAAIPGARFVMLESDNHVALEGEPAFARVVDEICRFAEEP